MSEPFLDPRWYRVAGLRPRLRGHVRVARHRYRGRSWYVARDDASGKQFRFTPTVYLMVGLMDGRRSVSEIWDHTVEQIGDDAPSQGEVVRLLASMHAADLIQGDVSPDTTDLFRRQTSHARGAWLGRYANPLSIRVPLADPDAVLDRLQWLVRPFMGMVGALLWLALVVPALVLAVLHWPELSENVTERTLTTENLLLVACIYPVVKFFHEIGHALAIKAGDGEVHDVGLMFITLVPVPYVDASASSAFRSKWRRAFVAAAGIMTEAAIAAVAMLLWVASEPGAVRTVAFNTMLIAGVSTVLFNGNPLLRFDGYFILCDLIEIPNLASRASQYWLSRLARIAFGVRPDPQPIGRGERLWFLAYAPLALAYRLTVVFGVALFLASKVLAVGVLLAVWGAFMSLGWPLLRGLAYVATSPRLQAHRGRAVVVSGALALGLLASLFLVQVPLHTVAEGVVWLPDDSIVRAARDGVIEAVAAAPGGEVTPGQTLFTSRDPSAEADVRIVQARIDGLQARLISQQFDDAVQADITRQEIAVRTAERDKTLRNTRLLTVASAATGTFVVPQAADLPGRFARRGDILGYVTPAQTRIVRAVVDQADIDLVRTRVIDAEVMVLDQPGHIVRAKLVREVPAASDRLPSKGLADIGGGAHAADPRDEAHTRTLQRTFQVDVEVPPDAGLDDFGEHALVRFDHGREPLAARWYRRLRQLFLANLDV